MKNVITILFSTAISFFPFYQQPANAFSAIYNGTSALAGCATSGVAHEFGHYAVASQVGAGKNRMYFLKNDEGSFFFGLNKVEKINKRDKPQHTMAGVAATSYLFEITLESDRRNPSWYKKGVMVCAGSDLLRYAVFTRLVKENKYYDPTAFSRQTGLSMDWIIGIGATQTLINFFRYKSGRDALIPNFIIDVKKRKVAFLITKKF